MKWEKADLEKMKKPELLRIAASLKLTVGSSPKPKIIELILRCGDLSYLSSVDPAVERFLGEPHQGNNPLHAFYGAKFLAVDRANQNGMGKELNVVFNSLPFWVFSGCVLFFLFFCFAVGVSGDLFLLFLDCLKPTPQ